MVDIVNGLLIREGAVLLARRSPQRLAHPDKWSFPGGHVEKDETREAALIRELQEEIGIVATDYALLGTVADPISEPRDTVIYHMYAVTAWQGGEPVLRADEHSELGWFSPNDAILLPDLAMDEYRPLLGGLA